MWENRRCGNPAFSVSSLPNCVFGVSEYPPEIPYLPFIPFFLLANFCEGAGADFAWGDWVFVAALPTRKRGKVGGVVGTPKICRHYSPSANGGSQRHKSQSGKTKPHPCRDRGGNYASHPQMCDVRPHPQSFSWNSAREYGWDPPNPIIQGI